MAPSWKSFSSGHIVQVRLGLLHGADGADEVGIHLFGLIGIGKVVLALKGDIVAVAANQNQVIALQGYGVDDLLEEAVQQLVIPSLDSRRSMSSLCSGLPGHLGGLEGDINQILADGAGQHRLKEGKITCPLRFPA